MKKIYKYLMEITDKPTIELPRGAKLLHIAEQNSALCLWALVDTVAKIVPVSFRVVGTGHEFNDTEDFPVFVGTALMMRGSLVFHVFTK